MISKKWHNLEILEEKLNYKFQNINIIKEALTHPSYNQKKNKGINNFQRLEFLGDSVLDLIVSEYIYYHLPSLSEGKLSKIKSVLVSRKVLAKWANKISLGEFLILGKGEDLTGGRKKTSILADCGEALIGAIYLDGGFQKTSQILLPYIQEELDILIKYNYIEDYKTLLQKVVQKEMNCLPSYRLIEEKGPEHSKIFCIMVEIKNSCYGIGRGNNKKEAEQQAAQDALKRLGIIN